MWYKFYWCLYKPKIYPIEITEFDILKNKIRLQQLYMIALKKNHVKKKNMDNELVLHFI